MVKVYWLLTSISMYLSTLAYHQCIINVLFPFNVFFCLCIDQGKVGRWTRAYHLKVPPPPMAPQPPRGGPRQRYQPTPRGVNMIVWSLDNRFVLAAIMGIFLFVASYV
jgi:hypothetical protein